MTTPRTRLLSRRNLEFQLFEVRDAARLCDRERYSAHSRETIEQLLDLSAELAVDLFADHNRAADLDEPRLVDGEVRLHPGVEKALRAHADAGLPGATADPERGGFGLPHVAHQASFLWFQAANIATASYAMLTTAAAHLLLGHAGPELVEEYVPPLLDGRAFGTMCLSEPGVGSSLGDVTTRADARPDGTHRLRGTKMWISGGDHTMGENIVHLVLARSGGPGVRGLSLFLVPKWLPGGVRNDVTLVGLNHKMGYRGTVNTVLAFGSGDHRPGGEPGAVGHLVGTEGGGLAAMFHMMNEARIGVGAGAVALGYTGYLHALEYARERTQGRELGAKDPALPPVPLVRHPDVRRMLLASKSYVEGGLALVLLGADLLDDSLSLPDGRARAEATLLLDLLTPVVKSWPSQWCLAADDLAIQVLGGSGYVRDNPVEQFYRDNRLNPIHEGTAGIQALDLLGRKVRAEGGAALRLLVERIRATAQGAADVLPGQAAALTERADRLVRVTERLHAAGDDRAALANATPYLEAFGHVVVAWLWLEQAGLCAAGEDSFRRGKLAAARYFFRYELPRVDATFDLLESGDTLLLDLDDADL